MLRHLGLIAGWAAATLAVVALGWAAVNTVTATVTSAPPLAQPPSAVDPAATTPPAVDGTSATSPVEDEAQTQTFDLVGGTIGIRSGSDAVELLFATPRPGFSVEVRSRGPQRVDIRFSSEGHESRFRLSPGAAADVEERPDSD